MQHRGRGKAAFRASFTSLFRLDDANRLTGDLVSGVFQAEVWWLARGLPFMALGLVLGGHLRTSVEQKTFRRAVSLLLIISRLSLLLK